jgi:mono/diheme cytochrome c family protein
VTATISSAVVCVVVALPLFVGGCQVAAVREPSLPRAGSQIPLFPPGDARTLAQAHCLACHSSELIQQQRLTEAQWWSEVDKMQRWGADIRDDDKAALVRYLFSRFGPDNDRFTPIVASP